MLKKEQERKISRPVINATPLPSSTSVYFQVVMSYLSFLCARLLDLRNETRAARVIQGAWRKYRLKKDLQLYKVGLEFGTTAKGWSFMDPIYYIYPKWLGVRVYSHVSSFVSLFCLLTKSSLQEKRTAVFTWFVMIVLLLLFPSGHLIF